MNSHYFGQSYEILAEQESFECDISEARITGAHMAFDWEENDEKLLASLSSEDGAFYSGKYGNQLDREVGTIRGWLFKSRAGEYVFWMHWENVRRGYEGNSLLFLSNERTTTA